MIYNDASLSFEVTSRTKTNIHTNIQFSTQDIDTARLIFTLTKDGVPLPLSAVSGKLVMYMADGSRFIKNVEIVDPIAGVAQYVLTSDEIKHYGTVNAELNLYYANKQALSVHKFSFVIDRALVDTDIVPVAEYYIDDFEALVAKVNELYDEAIATMEELRQKFSDLENIETKTGAQEKADKAEANAKAYTDVHANNKTIHITADERTTWNAKETTSGSQSKADKALGDAKAYTDTHANRTDNPHGVTKAQIGLANVSNVAQAAKTDFDTHVSDTVKHITADERTKWNGSQLLKITNDVGNVLVSAGDTDDFYTKITQSGRRFGTFYSTGKATNAPSTNSTRGFFHMTATDSNGLGTFGYVIAVDWQNNMFTNYLNMDTGWQGWRRVLSSSDLSPIWNNVTLINGAKQDSVYPFKFSVSNNVLWLRGSFGTLPAVGTSVAKFTNKPTQLVDFVVPTIGSYGTARFSLTIDGDLRYDGMTANDNSSVSRVSFNIGIPLW